MGTRNQLPGFPEGPLAKGNSSILLPFGLLGHRYERRKERHEASRNNRRAVHPRGGIRGIGGVSGEPALHQGQREPEQRRNLTVSFKEAGLGTNQNIDYLAEADATATYVCVNKGGANPSAQNKTTVAGPVSETGTFSSGKNGQVTASLTIDPPPSDISCPPGQSLQLAQVSYTNVSITDTTNGVTESIAGTFDSGCLLPRVRGACD